MKRFGLPSVLQSSHTLVIAFILNLVAVSIGKAAAPCPEGETPGVLVKCINPNMGFFEYANAFLVQYQTVIVTAASVLIVASGVQYMLAMGKSDQQAKAKQRITGILIGVIFFTLINALIVLLNPSARGVGNISNEEPAP